MKELEKTYNPADIEDRLYQKWLDNKYFHADAERGKREGKKPFTIVMPPPNITGQLHMGHALDNTMQDILIRYKRMQGYNALWQPGTDHAAIATEVKVIEHLKEQGVSKDDLGRDGFLDECWKWREEYGGRISRSVSQMEQDEQNGMDPARIGRYIAGIVEKKNPAVVYVAGAQYKFLSLLCKLLPAAARGKIVGKIYG